MGCRASRPKNSKNEKKPSTKTAVLQGASAETQSSGEKESHETNLKPSQSLAASTEQKLPEQEVCFSRIAND